MPIGGSATLLAARALADKIRRLAATLLEAHAEDIELGDGRAIVRGSPDRGLGFGELARTVHFRSNALRGLEPSLEATVHYANPQAWTFTNGAHLAVVDVDIETGKVRVLKYVAVDDCGRVVNPALVEGQIAGGIVQGSLIAFTLTAPAAAGQSPATLQVIVFPGGFNWPMWAAQDKGLFAREGLDVKLTPTPSSVFQLTNLIEGKFDIGMTAIDNVIAYQEGQGEAPVAGPPDLFAFMGGDNGFLRLVVQPEIGSYAELKGKELSVDALTTGYAFLLRKMLERGGLKEGEATLVRAGGVLQRWEALKDKKHAGTLLITPFEIIAESAGFRRLGNAVDVLGRYQGLVGAARRSWAQPNPENLPGFIRPHRGGPHCLYDRPHPP